MNATAATYRLEAAYHELARPSRRLADAATFATIEELPLLVQLAVAIEPGAAGGAGGSSGSSAPIALNAYDLLARIEAVVHSRWAEYASGKGRRTLRRKLQGWVDAVRTADDAVLLEDAEAWLTSWVAEIRALLDPPRELEVKAPCPACQTERVLDRYDDDGYPVYGPALTVQFDDGYLLGASCRVCPATWDRQRVFLLAAIVTAEPEPIPA